MILLIASKSDAAAMNIVGQLLMNYDFKETSEKFHGSFIYEMNLKNREVAKLVSIEEELIYIQSLSLPPSLKLLIFLSRHSSKSGTPTLSVHTPGNIGEATLGGLPRKVSIAPASAMKEALIAMKQAQEEANLAYEVSYECTHHGPFLDVPTMFVELGSSPRQWGDPQAAEVVAKGALAAACNERVYPSALGIGGPHYNRKFTNMVLDTEIAFGHIIPKYAICEIDVEILKQCVAKTVEPVEKIVLDWKGITGADKNKVLNLLKEINLKVEKI